MNTLRNLQDIAELGQRQSAGEFASYARVLLRHRTGTGLDKALASERISERVKAAVASETTTSVGPTLEQRILSSAFLNSLATAGVFDALLSSAVRLPLDLPHARVSTSALVGHEVREASAKPVTSLSITPAALVKRKSAALLVLTRELVESSASGLESLISRELRRGVIASTDKVFLAGVAAGVTSTAATGSILGDLEALADALDPDADSRLFLVVAPSVARHLAFVETAAGGDRGLPTMSVNGGEVGGVRVIVSDHLPTSGSPAAPLVMMLDAAQLLVGGDDVELRVAEHASVVMDDDPDMSAAAGSPPAPVPAELVSLWQVNARGLMAERRFGFGKARETAVATMAGGAW